MPYETQPGTLPHRVVEYLKRQPEGAEFATAVLCDAMDVTGGHVHGFPTVMAPARQAGLVKVRTKPGHGRTFYWSLGDGTPLQQEVKADPEGAAPEEEGDAPAGEAMQEFQAAAWADGDVDLYGLIELDDGGFRMTPTMVAKLKRLIAWMPAAA